MTYQPVVLEKFRGLNIRDDPGEVGWNGAAAASNVDILNGSIVTSPGMTQRVDSVSGSYVDGLQCGSDLVMVRTDGSHVRPDIISAALGRTDVGDFGHNSPPTSLIAYGNPGSRAVYVAFGDGGGWYKVENTGSWALTNLGGAKPYFLAVTPWDNRIVHANYHSASVTTLHASPSTVYFSDPGAPTTFQNNNYVLLRPGDGEEIRAMVTWRDFVIVFKESTMYVFTTPTVDPQGNPVFPYRAVPLGTRIDTNTLNWRTAVAGPDGVYFVSIDGIYRTDGFNIERVSGVLDPAWTRTSRARGAGEAPAPSHLDHGNAFGQLSFYQDQLFYRYKNLDNAQVLLRWDRAEDNWTQWDTIDPATVPIPWVRPSGGESLWVGWFAVLSRYEPLTTTGFSGDAIHCLYLTAQGYLANGEIATLRQWDITGTGTVQFATEDPDRDVQITAPVQLSATTTPSTVTIRGAHQGRTAALRFGSNTGPITVDRVVVFLREVRTGAR